jgi:hypothetical protein
MRSRSFRIGPADDNEFLAVEALCFAPEAPVARRIGRVDRFGDHAFEPKSAGMSADKLVVALLMVVELEAGSARNQGFQNRFCVR